MMAVVLAVASVSLILWAAVVDRRGSSRLPPTVRLHHPSSPGPLTRLGVALIGAGHRRFPRLTLPWEAADSPHVGAAAGLMVPLIVVSPWLAAVVAAVVLAWPLARRQADRRRRVDQIEAELPVLTDLLRIALDSGLNITLAVKSVVKRLEGPLAQELAQALRDVECGRRIADALDEAGVRAGPCTRPLIGGLMAAERYGSPLSSLLERLAQESRAEQSRKAERAAKRLSVYLLFPLAGFTLPAFALLTVAPLIAGSLGGLAFFE